MWGLFEVDTMRILYFRNPKTTQERRDAAALDSVAVRPSRNPANLPNAWDDIPKSVHRTWKRYRKTQYRPVDKTT